MKWRLSSKKSTENQFFALWNQKFISRLLFEPYYVCTFRDDPMGPEKGGDHSPSPIPSSGDEVKLNGNSFITQNFHRLVHQILTSSVCVRYALQMLGTKSLCVVNMKWSWETNARMKVLVVSRCWKKWVKYLTRYCYLPKGKY